MTKNRVLYNWIVVILITIIAFSLVFFLRQDFTYRGLCNASFVAFAIDISCFLLQVIARLGTFDTLAYVSVRFKESFKKNSPRSFEDAYHYHEFKNEKRKQKKVYYLPFISVSLLLLVLTIIFDVLSIS